MISARLKFLRRSRGLTQKQFADALGLTQQAVSQWERDDAEPRLAALKDIANFYNVTTDFLLDNKKHETVFTKAELNLIEKYRQLTDNDKSVVDTILDKFQQAFAGRQLMIDQSHNNGNVINVNGSNNVLSAR